MGAHPCYRVASPFGEEWVESGDLTKLTDQPGFTGHVKDTSTGLTSMQARYHDPVIGRFLSTDPVQFSPARTYMFSRYAYAANDPVNLFDPDGRNPIALAACAGPQAAACAAVGAAVVACVAFCDDAARGISNAISAIRDAANDNYPPLGEGEVSIGENGDIVGIGGEGSVVIDEDGNIVGVRDENGKVGPLGTGTEQPDIDGERNRQEASDKLSTQGDPKNNTVAGALGQALGELDEGAPGPDPD
ncbi:RHS repeat-associated core domain-containing protein [Parvularcula sp. ZS-1/3]|uniref:RHS repeat-associated core domain-containing protein n=1 Tax=Parvularcula mediterranea TaxID=2732508 RepID=A0A7Y3RIM2_9PROT|nr:RHS repeat-associated core domain-containing protein [Parvularcula mediterranea]NNU14779.1 RHS repeat-associated core domain-containing protein [Parvularcula mediterranea]